MVTKAFAVVVSSLGPGKTTLLHKAVDVVELEDNRDGVIHVVQARIAKKTSVKFRDQGFVKYTVVLHHPIITGRPVYPPGQIQAGCCWPTELRAQLLWLSHKG